MTNKTLKEEAQQRLARNFIEAEMLDLRKEDSVHTAKFYRELSSLLEDEVRDWENSVYGAEILTEAVVEQRKELLSFYRELFDFEAEYFFTAVYETLPNTVYHTEVLEDAEDLKNHLTGKVDLFEPSVSSYADDLEVEYELSSKEPDKVFRIQVDSLSLKEKYSLSERGKHWIRENDKSRRIIRRDQNGDYLISSSIK